jgi:hypothetical protein
VSLEALADPLLLGFGLLEVAGMADVYPGGEAGKQAS